MALLYIEYFSCFVNIVEHEMVFNKGKCEIILYDKWLEDCCINVILLKESCSQCDRNMTVLRIGIFKRIRLYH